jgi:hypothetical protein
VLPAQELKPKRCWIGVLSHDKAPSDALEETSFDWMIGHQVRVMLPMYSQTI